MSSCYEPNLSLHKPVDKTLIKVVDSCRIFSAKYSDTFRSFLYMERSKNLKKQTCHNRAKYIHFPMGVSP